MANLMDDRFKTNIYNKWDYLGFVVRTSSKRTLRLQLVATDGCSIDVSAAVTYILGASGFLFRLRGDHDVPFDCVVIKPH